MTDEIYEREERLIGKEAFKKLRESRVALFGLGGVGGSCAEALARAGIGELDLVDPDRVCRSNFNRQLLATNLTLGTYKADAAKERIQSIDPSCIVHGYKQFYLPETEGEFDLTRYDYIVDAIDMVTGKIALAKNAARCAVPIVSCMGTGNKLDPAKLEIGDLNSTSVCPLARVMRRELKKIGITRMKVVYSKEEPIRPLEGETDGRRGPVGSISFVPAAAGLLLASVVVRDLIQR